MCRIWIYKNKCGLNYHKENINHNLVISYLEYSLWYYICDFYIVHDILEIKIKV